MKLASQYLLIFLIAVLYACGSEPANNQSTENSGTDSTTTTTPAETYDDTSTPVRSEHDCTISGKVLEGNQLWLREKEILVAIVADSSTYDADYGDSHRILEVYNTLSCEQIARSVLPVNESPDFPYYIGKINYNNASQLVAIKGFQQVYCYDIENRSLLPALTPEFKSERYASDASSGMISRVEVWENYLVGYAQEYGTFVFDMRNPAQAKAVTAFAEYETPEGDYASLFLLPSDGKNMQAIMPKYDVNEDEFAINPIFDQPKAVSTNVPANARNNRFLVLREANDSQTPVALDLLNHKEINLPADVASKKTQEILQWMKGQ
jgi:hypothetical protein